MNLSVSGINLLFVIKGENMKKTVFTILVSLVFFSVAVPQFASAVGIEAAVGVWRESPTGDISYKGEELDVKDELRYDAKTKVSGRVKLQTPLFFPNIYLMATPMRYSADGSKNIDFTFGDKTFTADVPFSSKLRLDHYDICLYYNLPFIKTASLNKANVEIGFNARIIDFHSEISQADTGNVSKSLTVAAPMVYLGAQLKPVSIIALEAEIRGISYSSNRYYDLIGRLKVKPAPMVFIAGGYRYEDIRIDQSNVKASVRFSGPFAEAGFEF